jgi:tRNA dimethylallyltransferase
MPEANPVPPPILPVVLLFGPTASGKTAILEELLASGSFPCPAEVVSADSMQVYRGLDIGTAKPSPELRRRLPHHLIDIRDPREQFNAGEFVRLADGACTDIAGRGALPVVSGGAGFYLTNFVLGLPEAPPADPRMRQKLREERGRRGIGALAEELAACDPLSAGRIHIHDEYRLLRALEVFRLSGRPLSSYSRPEAPGTGKPAPRSRYRFLLLGISRSRDELYRRINERCAEMMRRGLAGEVRGLAEAGYGPDDPGLRAIGYREFFIPSQGAWAVSRDLAGVQALIAQNSRRYAKRQVTYFAALPGVKWISASAGPVEAVRRELAAFLTPRSPGISG